MASRCTCGLMKESPERPPTRDTRTYPSILASIGPTLAVSGQNVLLLCTLVLAFAAMAGVPLRLRLTVAMLAVAVYVPLAGGGPSIQRAGGVGIARPLAAPARRPAARGGAPRVGAGGAPGAEPPAGGGTGGGNSVPA